MDLSQRGLSQDNNRSHAIGVDCGKRNTQRGFVEVRHSSKRPRAGACQKLGP
ncbi:hypothetical protein CPB83DRAFT_857619 [Crepidotus variabilis]|uniref:Uncharacterized protein n=1 Tax=Crepidotus variabilis TaxID=179855 RepID=A0A9P6JNH9_9AGAR|nr:hypothetical protein CPB83DRAFT_857619 [Crepidotus variabilis]